MAYWPTAVAVIVFHPLFSTSPPLLPIAGGPSIVDQPQRSLHSSRYDCTAFVVLSVNWWLLIAISKGL